MAFSRIENDGLWKARPHEKSIKKLKIKLKRTDEKEAGQLNMDYRLEKLKQVIVGWVNYYRIGYFKTKAIQIDKEYSTTITDVHMEAMEDTSG